MKGPHVHLGVWFNFAFNVIDTGQYFRRDNTRQRLRPHSERCASVVKTNQKTQNADTLWEKNTRVIYTHTHAHTTDVFVRSGQRFQMYAFSKETMNVGKQPKMFKSVGWAWIITSDRSIKLLGSLRITRRQRHQTKVIMSKTMAVQVHYNSWYISSQSSEKRATWNDQILSCLENVNHDS